MCVRLRKLEFVGGYVCVGVRERERGLRERVCEREGEPPEFVLSEREKKYSDNLNVALGLEFRPLMHTEENGNYADGKGQLQT